MKNQIGRYEIQGELGRGGFGKVYRAFDPQVGRLVAVKVLTSEGDPDLLIRFRNEAAAAGKLRHKNIVTIFDFGEQDRTAYIVMELLEGEDLQRVISNRRVMTVLEKLEIMSQIAAGLHHAHLHGVVHRDVKPANMMLLGDGAVKIMDFGIALLAQAVTARLTPQGNIIGTFNYMAPEQFLGLSTDALSDIFAFGVLSYELLTGVHPFQASEPPAMMYNIMHVAPKPLRDLCPAAPEALEYVVARALEKDRELRYQSLEDLKFDVEPILLDLKREHSAGLLTEAQALTSAEHLDTAQKLIREILEMDPGNVAARQLREKVFEQLQRRAVRPRVQQLVQSGQQELVARRFPEAIQNFESALRLDRSDPEIQNMIEQARAMQHQSRRAERLLSEARQALEVRNLTGAYQSAREAHEIDPSMPEAGKLVDTIAEQIESRERARRLRDGLSRAKGKLLLQAFDEAISGLMELQAENAGSPEIAELLTRARAEKSAQEHKRLLESALTAAKEMIAQGKFAEAIERLEAARLEFPTTTEISDLLSYAQEELRAQQQAEAVGRITREVRTLVESRQFDRAVTLLKQGHESYPGDNQLARMLESTVASRASFEREQALAETSLAAEQLHRAASYDKAIQRIDGFVAEHGSDPGLAELRSRIDADRERQKKQETLREVLSQAGELVESGRAATAIQILRKASEQFPNEQKLLSFLTLAQAKLREQQRVESVAKIVNQAEELVATKLFDKALEVLDKGRESYPGENALFKSREAVLAAKSVDQRKQAHAEALRRITKFYTDRNFEQASRAMEAALKEWGDDPALLNLKTRIEASWESEQRSQAVRNCHEQVQQLIASGRPDEALAVVRDLRSRYPDDTDLESLETKATYHWDLDTLSRQVRDSLGRGGLEDAARKLTDNRKRFEGEHVWQVLYRETERRRAYETSLRLIEEWRRSGEYDRALELLKQLSGQHALDDRGAQLLQTITAERQAKERESAIGQVRKEAERLVQAGDIPSAIALLDRACRDFPDDAGLVRARAETQRQGAERGMAGRREKIARHLEAIRQALAAGDWQLAGTAVSAAQREFPGDSAFEQLGEEVRRGQYQADLQSFTNQVQQCLGNRDVEGAARQLAAGRQRFGQEPVWSALQADLDRRKAYEGSLRQAEELRQKGKHREAEALLQPIASLDPVDERAALLLQAVVSERKVREREQAIQRGRQEAENLTKMGDLEGSIAMLDQLSRQFPDDPALVRARLDAGRQAVERSQAVREKVGRHLQAIRQALAAGDWKLADASVAAALREFPNDSAFEQLGEEVRRGQQQADLEAFARQVRQCLQNRDLEGAAGQLERGRQRFGNEAVWEKLRRDLERRQAYENSLRRAEELKRNGRHQEARDMLQGLASQNPVDERAALLLQAVLSESEARQREQTIQSGLQEAEARAKKGDLPGAIAILDRLSRQYPDDPGLVRARLDVERQNYERGQVARREGIARHLQAIREALAARNWSAAGSAIQAAQKEFPDESAFEKFREQARQGQHQDELEQFVQQTQHCLDGNDLEGAARLLSGSRERFGREKLWQSLQRDLERHRSYEEALRKAEEYKRKEQYEKAEEVLRQMASQTPLDERATLLQRTVTAERAAKERENAAKKGTPGQGTRSYLRWLVPVAVLLVAGILWVVFRYKTPETITVEPDRREIALVYQAGSPEPQDDIVWKNPGIAFTATSSDPSWLVVTPEQGAKLDRLHVSARTTGLSPGTKSGTITLTPKTDAPVVGTLVVAVSLTIKREEPPAQPPPQAPLVEDALKIAPSRLDFQCQFKGKPETKQIAVLQGRILKIEPRQNWLQFQQSGSVVHVSADPTDLDAGLHTAALVLTPASGKQIAVPVTLNIVKPVPVAENPSPPKRPAPDRLTYDQYKGPLRGDVIWRGQLAPGAEVRLMPDASSVAPGSTGSISGDLPLVTLSNIHLVPDPAEVTVDWVPGDEQLRIRNPTGRTFNRVTIHWSIQKK